MKAVSKILAGGVAIAALASAAPAAAQYGYGYGYPGTGGNVVGQVLNQVFGGYGSNGYNSNSRVAVQQCAAAVEQRLNGGYGGYGNSGYGGYGGGYGGAGYGTYGGGYGGGRVLGITHADMHSGGIFKVRGVATSGMNSGYGGGYGGYGGYGYAQQAGDLKFLCEVDYRGYIRTLKIDRNPNAYGYDNYGYRRY
ncbi:MAG: hypothetical protein ABI422_05050 [Sphingomicrobium sp.]